VQRARMVAENRMGISHAEHRLAIDAHSTKDRAQERMRGKKQTARETTPPIITSSDPVTSTLASCVSLWHLIDMLPDLLVSSLWPTDHQATTRPERSSGKRKQQSTTTQTENVEHDRIISQLRAAASARSVVAKIGDLGTACWTDEHYAGIVTTTQYRAPEVIIGYEYDTPIDMWSVACIAFEMVTGDFLFQPKVDKRGHYSRNEDHLALITELAGPLPKFVIDKGRHAFKYYNSSQQFKHIHKLDFWPLDQVLFEKYGMPKKEAAALASFLMPMLDTNPHTRITAKDALRHPWLHSALHHPEAPVRDVGLSPSRDAHVLANIQSGREACAASQCPPR